LSNIYAKYAGILLLVMYIDLYYTNKMRGNIDPVDVYFIIHSLIDIQVLSHFDLLYAYH